MSVRLCWVCNGPVVRQGTEGRMPRYCTPACKRQAAAARRAAERRDYWDQIWDSGRRRFRSEHLDDEAA